MSGSNKVYRSSQDWYKNRHSILVFQRNILFIFAFILTACLFFSTIFINYISSNKSLEPYVIEIEKITGKPKVIKVNEIKEITEDKIVKKYFITNLIKSLFFYRRSDVSSELDLYLTRKNDEFIKNFSSQPFRKFFISEKRKLRQTKIHSVDIKIKTIQFPEKDLNVAKIRILRIVKFNNGDVKNFNELLEIGFKIDHSILQAEEQKEQNPIGFIADDYTITEESFEY
jgi:type IV secretion system protein VirB8